MFVLGKIAGGPSEHRGRKLGIHKASLPWKTARIGLRKKRQKSPKCCLDAAMTACLFEPCHSSSICWYSRSR